MKPFLTSYSQLSLFSPLRSRIENRCCHEPTYLLKTGLLSFPFFTTYCFAPTRCNRFTCQPTTSASTANFSSKDFYPTQKQFIADLKQDRDRDRDRDASHGHGHGHVVAKQTKEKPLHQHRHANREGRPFYPKSFLLSKKRKIEKNITAKHKFSILGVRKRFPLGVGVGVASHQHQHQHQHQHHVTVTVPSNTNTNKQGTGIKLLDTTPCSGLPARLGKGFSVHRTGRRVFNRSLLPEKFINLLMANGEKDKARRCLTQALFSINTHCQKHNLQNNSPLKIFTDSFFKQESTESKVRNADNSLKKANLGCVQQKTRTNELLTKGKGNTLFYPGSGSKRDANPGKPVNVLRDVALVLLENRLDNLSNGSTKKSLLYPSAKESQGLLFMPKGASIFRLNHIERVEKRLLSKQNGFFFLFVKQKGKVVGEEKQTGKFKIPLSLPFCGKSFETTFPVFLRLSPLAKQNNLFLSLIRLSLKEKFLISEKGFAFPALHKKVPQSYLCSALLHLSGNKKGYRTEERSCFTLFGRKFISKAIPSIFIGAKQHVRSKCPRYTTTLPWFAALIALRPKRVKQQIHFLPFLPYFTPFNWRKKRLNPLFGFAKQSQRFLLELCKAIPNRSVKGTEKVRQNNFFGSFPLLSPFYFARTPSSPFSTLAYWCWCWCCLARSPSPSRTVAKAKKSTSYKDEYVQQNTKLETKGLDKFIALLLSSVDRDRDRDRAKGHGHGHQVAKQDKQLPQNNSHSNTKERKTFLCFTQGSFSLVKKVFSQEKDIKSVHTKVLLKGIQRVQPTLEVRRVRKGRNTFQVPSVVKQKRGEKVGIKWIIDSAKSKKRKGNKLFSLSLANQLVQSFDRLGEARSKRNELLKLAESNRPFLRFRWW